MATHKNTQRFNCTACGATDDTARCLGNSTIHTGGRWMMPADFNRYMAARRPVDREAVAALRDANKSARAAIAATTDPTHLDTTAAAWNAAEAAFQATGTDLAALQSADDLTRQTWHAYKRAATDAGVCLKYAQGCRNAAIDMGRCTAHALPQAPRPAVKLYRVENPHTGAVEFPEYTGLPRAWA